MNILVKSYKNLPPPDMGEIYRYMSMPKLQETEARIAETVRECISELAVATHCGDVLQCNVCYTEIEITRVGDKIDLGFAVTDSHDLGICLRGCDRAVIFAATIGGAIDRLTARYTRLSPVKALALSAIGSERVEALCDEFCRELKANYAAYGCDIRPRYSPGYGDLPLEFQREVFRLLEPSRRIGVYLGETLLMTPAKSVTAIVGVKRQG